MSLGAWDVVYLIYVFICVTGLFIHVTGLYELHVPRGVGRGLFDIRLCMCYRFISMCYRSVQVTCRWGRGTRSI